MPEVLLAIDAALAAGLKVKVNAVSMPDTDWKRLITLARISLWMSGLLS
ncbi:MAG: hypothetical protein V8S58_09565 [Lachnospiraceae bacterium]